MRSSTPQEVQKSSKNKDHFFSYPITFVAESLTFFTDPNILL
jgi:hypothetical protein